jgi:predicted Zn-dependent peptidase
MTVMTNSTETLSNLSTETRSFPPPPEFAAQANATEEWYARAEADREGFWAEQAERLSWERRWDEVVDWSGAPFAKWFVGGRLNVAYNCVDRHVAAGHGEQVAFHWEGEPGDTRTITYADLRREVCKAANALIELGVRAGDRVAIQLPMIPEAVFAMLACARLGAMHSVVFGGFSPGALKARIEDAQAKLLITSDGQFRRGKPVPMKENTDQATAQTPSIEHVLVVRRTETEVPWTEGRDLWWHELVERQSDQHTPEAFELLSEMLLAPTYADIDSEREVVLEEIAMYEDEPMDRVHDFLADAIFGEHPLGRRVLGAADVIASIPVPEIDAYHRARYVAPNVVVSAAGHVEHDAICALSERLVSPPAATAESSADDPPQLEPRLRFQQKETEQYHVCFGGPGLTRSDERRFALAVLDSIFGGATSSRLFVEVREKRGLAYSVGSYNDQYTDHGLVATYVGTREDNVEKACRVIAAEIQRLRSEPVSEQELERAKEHVKGRLVLSSESTATRMSRNARAILFGTPLYTLDEMLDKVDVVTVEDVTALGEELYDQSRLSAACIGRSEDVFRAAVADVAEPLAAA